MSELILAKLFLLYLLFWGQTLFAQVDTTYFSNFIENLKKVEVPLPKFVVDSSYKKAQNLADNFAEEFNSQIPGNINKINPTLYLKISSNYEFDNKHLFALGYALIQDSANIEDHSAHIFVFGEYTNDRIIFFSEMSEFEGEIQFKLLGYENSKNEIRVYGEAYPYFGSDYGKFILSAKLNFENYIWQYHLNAK